jgi:molecular chaperone DnaJ
MQQRDHYEVLGVRRDAAPEEIKTAFRRLAAQCHPDLRPGDPTAHDRFKEINHAYQVLSDPNRRSLYDRLGHRAEAPGSPFGGNGPFPGGYVDISEIAIDGFLGDLLGVFGVGKADKGDLKCELEISLEEAAFGCEKTLAYERTTTCASCLGSGAAKGSSPCACEACDGRGRVRLQQGIFPIAVERSCSRCRGSGRTVAHACSSCRGSGLLKTEEALRITLPPGVPADASQRISGAGSRPRPDRAHGDLEVTVRVQAHSLFRREGDDIYCKLPVSFPQAALGGEVDVPTLDGRSRLKVPSGTQPGAVLRMKGKGAPKRSGSGRGDQHVEIAIDVPTRLTEKQTRLLQELAAEVGDPIPAPPQRKSFMGMLRDIF